MEVQQIVTYLGGLIAAAWAGWQTVTAYTHKKGLKKVGNKYDIDTIILKGMFLAKNEYDGGERHCGKCGGDADECSKQRHMSVKKDFIMRYVKTECEKAEKPFDYQQVSGRVNEFMLMYETEIDYKPETCTYEKIEARMRIGLAIEKLLERALISSHADRAYVMEFHNGLENFSGISFLRMSCTYEATAPGIRHEQMRRENVLTQTHSRSISHVFSRDYLVLDVRNRAEDETTLEYEILADRGVVVNVRAKIVDINKRVLGHFGIDFCKDVDDVIVQRSIEEVKKTAIELGVLLSVEKQENKNNIARGNV